MKKGYWIVGYRSVASDAVMQEYGRLAGVAVQANGGKAIVRTAEAITPVEAGAKQRTVVIEFPSYEIAVATYQSESYKAALDVLGSAVERDFKIVEGL